MRIVHLTPRQRALIPAFVDKWIGIGLSTEPIDHRWAERALSRLYARAGLAEPRILWLPCPLSGMLSALLYAGCRDGGNGSRATTDFRERSFEALWQTAAPPDTPPALRHIVERAVAAALCACPDHDSGVAAPLAIAKAYRVGLDRHRGHWVDEAIAKRLRALIVEPVRAALSLSLGGFVEERVNRIGQSLRHETRLAGWGYFGAPLWAAFAAEIDYLTEVLGLPLDRTFLETVAACGLYWTFAGVCFAAERPRFINRDGAGALHCEVGPSLGYPSGWNAWHWHGVLVPQRVVERPQEITIAMIERVKSSLLRRVLIERYRHAEETHGVAAFLRDAGGIRLDHDEAFGTLWRREMPEDEPLVMVEVVNHSPEPDGSYRHYFLRVHPELRPLLPDGTLGMPQVLTARNAVASTFGLRGDDYAPETQT